MDGPLLQRNQRRVKCAVFLLLLLATYPPVSASTSEEYNRRSKEKSRRKSQPVPQSEPSPSPTVEEPQPSPRTQVVDASVECTKQCNYDSFNGHEGHCFGLFATDCTILQLFADGHILETKTQVQCIGRYRNETANDGYAAVTKTTCSGQFDQTQVLNVYETVIQETADEEDVMVFLQSDTYYSSYSCRHSFLNTRKINVVGNQEPSLLTATVEVSCDSAQAIQIQKAHCTCSTESCSHPTNSLRIIKDNKSGSKLGTVQRNFTDIKTETNKDSKKDDMAEDSVAVNFKKVAAEDPELAWEVAQAIISSASSKNPNGVLEADIHPVIMDHYTSRIYENNREVDGSLPRNMQPATSWLDVSCNGANTAFASRCNGRLSADVRFGQEGNAFISCNGRWKSFEDVTYLCDGTFTEDESDFNNFGSAFSKVSRCSGAVAISPLSSKVEGNTKYYGLSEICNGDSLIQASYSMEELDHRYLAHIVDPRTVEQVICLLDHKNCEELRYFV